MQRRVGSNDPLYMRPTKGNPCPKTSAFLSFLPGKILLNGRYGTAHLRFGWHRKGHKLLGLSGIRQAHPSRENDCPWRWIRDASAMDLSPLSALRSLGGRLFSDLANGKSLLERNAILRIRLVGRATTRKNCWVQARRRLRLRLNQRFRIKAHGDQ